MPKRFYDDEGNEYTPEQARAAFDQMTKDEAGEGTLGGLAQDDNLQPTPTQAAVKPQAAPDAAPEPVKDPTKRELNPLHFGDFLKSNIFGGLDAKYVTGKRPMTLFDYVTDAAAAYGGEDIGKRNARLITTEASRRKDTNAAALSEQRIATSRAQQQKIGLETEKLAGEAIQKMMYDLDADLWLGELKALTKEHGLAVRPGTLSMVERMVTKLHEAGAGHPAEVLENPDKYDPALVNRVRHTMTLLNKSIEESQGRQQELEKGKQALGLREGEEQRKQEQFTQSQTGVNEAIDLLTQQADTDDPNARRQALGRIAALRQGGTAAQKVLEELGGITKPAGTRNLRDQGFRARAEEMLPNGTPGQIAAKAEELRRQSDIDLSEGKRVATLVAEGRTQAARALANLNVLRKLGSDVLTRSAVASYGQPIEFFFKRQFRDPKIGQLQAVPGTLSNLARGLGEKGVLTDTDLARVQAAVQPVSTDTWQTFSARLDFVQKMIAEGQAALERAQSTGRIEPVDSSGLGSFDGDPYPPGQETGQTQEAAPTADGGNSQHELAKQWSARLKAMPNGPEKEALRKQAFRELGTAR